MPTAQIIIFIGNDGKIHTEAAGANGTPRKKLDHICPTEEQIDELWAQQEAINESAQSLAISRNRQVWEVCAKHHGADVANRTIGKAKRTKNGVEVHHPQKTRQQQLSDLWDHEEEILENPQRAETLRQIPREELPLDRHRLREIIKQTLARYGFTQEEITLAQVARFRKTKKEKESPKKGPQKGPQSQPQPQSQSQQKQLLELPSNL